MCATVETLTRYTFFSWSRCGGDTEVVAVELKMVVDRVSAAVSVVVVVLVAVAVDWWL